MNQERPHSVSRAVPPSQPHSSVCSVVTGHSSRPPRPELPSKWAEKRQQVLNAARLRRDSTELEATPPSGDEMHGEPRAEVVTWEAPWPEQTCGPTNVGASTVRLRSAHPVYLPVGMFVAGFGLLIAAGLQLFVILPSVFLRRSLVWFACGVVRRSTTSK